MKPEAVLSDGRAACGDLPPARPAQHTPGPWFVFAHAHRDEGPGSFSIGTNASEGLADILCSRFQWPERAAEMAANARLIAAAPEMLGKLRELAGECSECQGEPTDNGEPCPDCADIRAVIANAAEPRAKP